MKRKRRGKEIINMKGKRKGNSEAEKESHAVLHTHTHAHMHISRERVKWIESENNVYSVCRQKKENRYKVCLYALLTLHDILYVRFLSIRFLSFLSSSLISPVTEAEQKMLS